MEKKNLWVIWLTQHFADIANYNGPNITLDVNLADFIGEYELGKRDIAGGCINLSLLKQKDIDDVC